MASGDAFANGLHERLPTSKLDLIDAGHLTWEDAADQYAEIVTPASPVLRTCEGVGLCLIETCLSCCPGVAWGLPASPGASTTSRATTAAAPPLRPSQRREGAGGAASGGGLLSAP